MALRVLLIDDDARLAELLSGYLAQHDVVLSHARDGIAGIARLDTDAFDAVLLDVMMPGIDGLEVLRRLRKKSKLPVIMLTARGDESDRVVGLELGADDYIPKPFSPRELLARVRAVLRRAQPDLAGERVFAQDLVVDVGARRATVAGREVELTGIE
ncbi:MAG: response regulator transcription factor, partial [Polyangiaceae bacterium]|nr:response regulator transcription factor [Polyangiaceae bacterium]